MSADPITHEDAAKDVDSGAEEASREDSVSAAEGAAQSLPQKAARKDSAVDAAGAELKPENDVFAVPDELLSSQVVPVIEALLYAAEEPVPVKEIVDVLSAVAAEQGHDWAEHASAILVERASLLLSDRLLQAGSALHVMEVAGGLRLGTRPQFDPWIRALRRVERPSRLSVAALETLAVVAYRQPVTQAEIAAVRGVDPSASLRTLRDQGLVRITGRKRAVGRPFTYGTTRQFLEIFGLRDLDELPDPEEFEELLEG